MKKSLPKITAALFVFLSFAINPLGKADSVTLSVTSNSAFDTDVSTGVWNIESGLAHPPLEVINWNDGGIDTDTNLFVGDGSHGEFSFSRYAYFSKDGDISGNTIRINTDDFPILKVTSFHLEATWTIRPEGTQPLEIQSLSTILIEGDIDCSGNDGDDITHLDDTVLAQGGEAVCSGGSGGSGGTNLTAATDGTESGAGAFGGEFGAATNAANGGSGGGGGGGYSQVLAGPGVDPSASGGEGDAGDSQVPPDNAFTIPGGGAGGGGGGVYNQADADQSNGAGGGAGGGIVYLTAVGDITIAATGSINTDGGDGGSAAPGLGKGGAGGGGAGGSIRILSGGEVTLVGPVTALEGAGGTSDGGDGGDGARGRTWITDSTGGADCFPTGNTDNPQSILAKLGCVGYKTGVYYLESQEFDLKNTSPKLNSLTSVDYISGASTVEIQMATSTDDRFSDNPNWSTSLSSNSGERFLKFRIAIDNSDPIDTATFTSLSLNYSKTNQEEFLFTNSCGAGEDTEAASMLILLLPLSLAFVLRRYHKIKA